MDDGNLHIELFGKFRMEYEGETVAKINKPRLQELLAYLLLNCDTPQSRRQISFLFWPDSTEKQARNNLRQLVHRLRKTLPDAGEYLITNHKTLKWNTDAHYGLDIAEFERKILEAEEARKSDDSNSYELNLSEAESLYNGPLLKNCYKKWIVSERERLKGKYVQVLEELVEMYQQNRDYGSAVEYAQKLLQCDSYRESAYQVLMRLQALNGERASALKTYEECVRVFKEELEAEPGPKIQKLYNRIKDSGGIQAEKKIAKGSIRKMDQWPLVGRRPEWDLLLTCWKETLAGNTQGVIIRGAPGIGKTRLAVELFEYIRRQGYTTAYTKTYESAGALSYGPVAEWLRSDFIRRQLSELDTVWLNELVRLLPELISEHEDLSHPNPLKEPWQRKRFFEAVTKGIIGNGKPRLIILDDLQWCDGETLAWLDHLLHFESHLPLLMVGTMRPVEAATNDALQQLLTNLRREQLLQEISLDSLDESDTSELARKLTNIELNEEQSSKIYHDTEGNPLFVVEGMREGVYTAGEGPGSGNGSSTGVKNNIPSKVTEVIASRFGRLSKPARKLMDSAAVVGNEFTFDILVRASNKKKQELINLLEELMNKYIIREQQDDVYDFTHDKLREVAYKRMTRTRRRWLHQQIAEALEKKYQERIEEFSGKLAFHFDRAGQLVKSIKYFIIAAKSAREIFANNKSLESLNRALELLKRMPEDEEKDRMQQSAYVELAVTHMQSKGMGSQEVFEACEKAYNTYTKLDEQVSASILRIHAIGALAKGNLDKTLSLGKELYTRNTGEECVISTEAHYVLGAAHFWKGNFTESMKYFKAGISSYSSKNEQIHLRRFGQNPYVVCEIRLSILYWIIDRIDEAEELRKKALKDAEKIDDPFSLDYVRIFNSWLYALQENFMEAQKMVKQTLSSSSDYGFPYWYSFAEMFYGWALIKQGMSDKGMELLQKGISDLETTDTVLQKPQFFSWLADALAEQGEIEEAVRLIEHSLDQIGQTGEHWIESEIYRMKGKILLIKDPSRTEEAVKCFKKAIDIAETQGAESFKKRAENHLKQLG